MIFFYPTSDLPWYKVNGCTISRQRSAMALSFPLSGVCLMDSHFLINTKCFTISQLYPFGPIFCSYAWIETGAGALSGPWKKVWRPGKQKLIMLTWKKKPKRFAVGNREAGQAPQGRGETTQQSTGAGCIQVLLYIHNLAKIFTRPRTLPLSIPRWSQRDAEIVGQVFWCCKALLF